MAFRERGSLSEEYNFPGSKSAISEQSAGQIYEFRAENETEAHQEQVVETIREERINRRTWLYPASACTFAALTGGVQIQNGKRELAVINGLTVVAMGILTVRARRMNSDSEAPQGD